VRDRVDGDIVAKNYSQTVIVILSVLLIALQFFVIRQKSDSIGAGETFFAALSERIHFSYSASLELISSAVTTLFATVELR